MTSGKDADNAALCDALAIEHSTIYGYGIVSAMSPPSVNDMVVEALEQHRQRRDDVIAMLTARKVTAPVAAAGYQLPLVVAARPTPRGWPPGWRTTAPGRGASWPSTPRRATTARSPPPPWSKAR